MHRKPNIKWRSKDTKALGVTVQRFNAKITRTLKKHPEFKDYLPDKMNTKDIKQQVKTRQDLNRIINSLNRFMKKGAEVPHATKAGVMVTAWEKKELGIKIATINRARTAERKRANVSTYKGNTGTIRSNSLKPKRANIEGVKPSDWSHFVRGVEKQIQSNYYVDRSESYKRNYIEAVTRVFSVQDASAIINIIRDIPSDTFADLLYDDPVLELGFIYSPLESSLKADTIIEHLNELGY